MKKLILLLCIASSINIFAGNPKKDVPIASAITKTIYVITPQPTANKPLVCCKFTNLGYSWLDGCFTILYECWGDCGNHGWSITSCQGGVKIRGARMAAGNNGPIKISLPLTTGLINTETFDVNKDVASQMTEINKIKNSTIEIYTDLTVESEDYILILKKGNYQIENSNLLVIAE